MIVIDSFKPSDLQAIQTFVEAIQKYERKQVPELKPGIQIGASYAQILLDTIAKKQGLMFIARASGKAIGFICAWIEQDDDPLLQDDARKHAFISDLFVDEACRRQNIGRLLLQKVETEMRNRGCKRIRICSKASNSIALKCYESSGYAAYEVVLAKSLLDSEQ
jgi:ribosomal protein S18 acetylase RimI-like enzyme